VPGPVVVRPIWAPALVAFVGGGAGFRFSAGVGVGWFPLAPGEVYLPGYRVSRAYVNQVNITNTAVSVTRVTEVYNTVVVNRTTVHGTTVDRRAVNNISYANQRVTNGVTVVSRDAFVNARPVAQNIMKVDAHEIAAAPVSHLVAAEPIHASVVGAGRPVAVKPPAAVVSRPVVAVRTPSPPPQPIEQRQSQAGGHLNQQALVRPAGASQPAASQNRSQPPAQDGFKSFTPPGGNSQVRQLPQTQPRVYEMQGSPQVEDRPGDRQDQNGQPVNPQSGKQDSGKQGFHPPQRQNSSSQEAHPLVRPTPPVQERSPQQEQQQEQKFNQWQQQRPASPPPAPRPAPPPRAAPAPAAAPPPKK
jgi:hypothetical protein